MQSNILWPEYTIAELNHIYFHVHMFVNRITGLELSLSVIGNGILIDGFGNGILTDGEECCLLYMRFTMLHSLTIRNKETQYIRLKLIERLCT